MMMMMTTTMTTTMIATTNEKAFLAGMLLMTMNATKYHVDRPGSIIHNNNNTDNYYNKNHYELNDNVN